ncbi:MAG: molybdate ABC transporter substrate-binding protein [Pseudomonadota bacterium]
MRINRRDVLGLCVAAVGINAMRLASANDRTILVFAAASLKSALEDIATAYTKATGTPITLSFAASSALARQIEFGAPADIFISANVGWMDRLERAGLIDPASRSNLAGNELVLIAHDRTLPSVDFSAAPDLKALLGNGRLAMALVDAVPAGIYGKTALSGLGLWEPLAERIAQTDNVRTALALVARGEAPLGIVYATDALADDRVRVIGQFPRLSHPPIVYPAAAIARKKGDGLALDFLQFLSGPEAQGTLRARGFRVPAD